MDLNRSFEKPVFSNGSYLLLVSIMLIAFWIRIQGVERIPDGQFTETDGYFYYWQATLITENGHLPARDMRRWLPLGRDLGQTLNLYGYVLAYSHKAVASVFPNVTLYHVSVYMPVVCFCIGIGVLCFYLYHTYGLLFSSIVGVLLATMPGSIERSTAGFGDRDAFCLMIGILAIITYLMSLRVASPRQQLLWTLISSFTVFLGGLSWEGFGVFLSVIIVVELWRFLTSEIEEGLGQYILWVCCFVPALYLVSPAYRNGYGFAEHLTALVLLPPIVFLAMRSTRYMLISKVEILRQHARTLSLGLTLACVTLAISYVFGQHSTFADTTVPLSQNAVMAAMTELRNPHFRYWIFRYGSVFIIGSIGLILINKWHWDQTYLLVPLILFIVTTFFREPLEKFLWNASHGTTLFFVAVTCTGIAFLISARLQKSYEPCHFTIVAFMAWFLFWVALSRDAKRYDFFIGVPLTFFTAEIITFVAHFLSRNVKQNGQRGALKTCLASLLLAGILFFPPLGAHAKRSIFAAARMRKGTPTTDVTNALHWMKAELSNTTIVAAHWAYGSQLNVLAEVKTITDQDTYLQHWILLYYQHVHKATSEREVLEYLKTHGITHLMLTKKEPHDSFLRGQLSTRFVPVYPEVKFADAPVKVWKLHYPPDIQTDPKYLKTGFPEIDENLQHQ